MDCPTHRRRLDPIALDHARCWTCAACGGRALTVALLRRMMPAERLHALWGLVRAGSPDADPCPSCARPMRVARANDRGETLPVAGCTRCHVVWLGAATLRAIAPDASSPRPVLDAPVPGDASGEWVWTSFFRTLTEKHFVGPADLL